MRFIFLLLLGTFISNQSFSQIYDPVKWKTDHKQVSDNEFDLIFTATIEDGWYVYSQYLESDDGPVRTSFNYDEGDHFSLKGKNVETGNKKEGFDKLFDMNVIKFSKKITFTQRVEVKDFSKNITGYLEFMTCDDTKCLPPADHDFDFKLVPATKSEPADQGAATKPVETKATEITTTAVDKVVNTVETKKEEVQEVIKKEIPQTKTIEEKKPTTKIANNKTEAAKPKAIEKVIAENATEEKVEKVEEATSGKEKIQKIGQGGIFKPVTWTFKGVKKSEKEFDLVFTAKIDEGWYIYSQFLDGEDGPIPTSFLFTEGDHFSLKEKVVEAGPKRIKEYDETFEMDLIKFKKEATFTQTVTVSDLSKPIVGDFEFMTCEAGRCLPPAIVPFSFSPTTMKTLVGDEFDAANASTDNTNTNVAQNDINGPYPLAKMDKDKPVGECSTEEVIEEGKSIWSIFGLGFLGGLLALLTPCVFPMIPLTVSFFTKGSENKSKGILNAILYGFFILMVYLLLSIPFHVMSGINSDILNEISTNIWLNIFFFVIFIFFAFSFFGYYELTLPSSWTNKASGAESAGGFLGIFFMALTLALVSFSCTGPILGTLLAGALSSDGGAWQLTSGMGGFGLALAMPFALFAAFPSWLNSLPKSGGWLNSVKVVLGFLELALAFKFLSNADLVKHWGLLKIEPFLVIWILCALGIALYMFGKIKFPHDSPIKKLSFIRISTGVLAIAIAVYLASGFRYNDETGTFTSLPLLSGIAPPVGYSWVYPNDCPNNLDCFKDLDAGWAYAQKAGKPVMLDFTGYACVNCRKMEEHVWPKKKVFNYLKEDYVLISLYVDDKKELPEADQVTVDKASGGTRKLRNYGNKWAHFQAEYFENNSQPYYVLLSPDGQLLNRPVGYTPDDNEYASFLECGLQTFKELSSTNEISSKALGQK